MSLIESKQLNKADGYIVSVCSVVAGILYFIFIAPLHRASSEKTLYGKMFFIGYLVFVCLVMLSGILFGLYISLKNTDTITCRFRFLE